MQSIQANRPVGFKDSETRAPYEIAMRNAEDSDVTCFLVGFAWEGLGLRVSVMLSTAWRRILASIVQEISNL